MAAPAEQQLIDSLKRIEPVKAVSTALLIRISALNPANRTQNHVHMTQTALNELIIRSQSSMHVMANNDIVIVGQGVPPRYLTETVDSVRRRASERFHPDIPAEPRFRRGYGLREKKLERAGKPA